MKVIVAVLALLALLVAGSFAQNQTCDVNYGTFAGAVAFPVAQSQNFFQLFNISICVYPITSSTVGYGNLSRGEFDLIAGSTDNVYSRYFNYPGFQQNATLLTATAENFLQVIAGGASINTWEDFRNGTFVVDAPTSGLVILLRRALAIRNLYFERGDYKFLTAGTSAARFNAIVNNINGTVGGVLATPYSANLLASNNTFYGGSVKVIGQLNNEILPVQGTSQQSTPQTLNNPTKFNGVSRFIAAVILGRRFLANPQNRETVLNIIRAQNQTQYEPAIQLIYNASVDPATGEVSPSLRFTEVALKNGFFLKEVFGGAPYNNTDYQPAFTPGRGRLIDYSALDAAEALVAAFVARFRTNTNGTAVCAYSPLSGARFTVNQFVASVVNRTSGGCTSAVTGTFLNCTSDANSAPANCVYNATSDSLSVAVVNAPGQTSRTYTAAIQVKDACGTTNVVNRVVTVYASTPIRPGCTLVLF